MTACPQCNLEMMRVIYFGFPMWLCPDEVCGAVDGFWSFLPEYLNWFELDGYFMFFAYEGNYFQGMYHYLFDGEE